MKTGLSFFVFFPHIKRHHLPKSSANPSASEREDVSSVFVCKRPEFKASPLLSFTFPSKKLLLRLSENTQRSRKQSRGFPCEGWTYERRNLGEHMAVLWVKKEGFQVKATSQVRASRRVYLHVHCPLSPQSLKCRPLEIKAN